MADENPNQPGSDQVNAAPQASTQPADSTPGDAHPGHVGCGCGGGGRRSEDKIDCTRFRRGNEIGGRLISELVFCGPDFVVVLCEKNYIYFECDQNDPPKVADLKKELRIRAEILNALPVRELRSVDEDAYYGMIAQALVATFQNRFDFAETLLERIEKVREARLVERARFLYLVGAVATFAAAVFCGAILYAFLPEWEMNVWVALVGAAGAFYFSLIRRGELKFNGEAAPWSHHADGFVRIMVGLLSGLVALAAFKSKLIIGFVDSSTSTAATISDNIVFVLCFLSGYSERLIPNLMTQLDTDTKPRTDAPPTK
jgi:hypothetical protein